MSDRKIAYLATVESIEDLPGKDKIGYVKLKDLGWQIIASKDLKPNTRVVYIEYDTLVKPAPWCEFLRKRCWSDKYQAFKISAMKMAGVVSYGLILRIDEIWLDHIDQARFEQKPDGFDLSQILAVSPIDDSLEEPAHSSKYTRFPIFLKKRAPWLFKIIYPYLIKQTSDFPSFLISKSDETRIEVLSHILSDPSYQGKPVYVTLKCDGQSLTCGIYKGKFYLASRNLLKYSGKISKAISDLSSSHVSRYTDNFLRIACMLELPRYLALYRKYHGRDFALQGELCGPGITQVQSGQVIFDVKTDKGEVIKSYSVEAEKAMGFKRDLESELENIKSIHHVDSAVISQRQQITG